MPYRKRYQYQQLALTPLVTAGTATLAVPVVQGDVFFTRQFQYQAVATPVPIVSEVVTVDKWFQPLAEPVRIKRGLSVDRQQVAAQGYPFTPSIDWFLPLSASSVGIKRPVTYQQFFAWSNNTPEVISTDKWFSPLADPIRAKPGLKTGLQQFLAFQGPAESVTVDKWFEPLADPVRTKPGLRPGLQQSITSGQPIVSFSWFASLSEPIRAKKPVAQQQYLAWGYTTPGTVSVDEWFASWRDPAKRKSSLLPSQQQASAFVPTVAATEIQFSYSPEIIPRLKYIFFQTETDVFVTTETVTVDKWFASWRDPVRAKIGLKPSAQQFLAHAPFEEQRTLDKWYAPWRDPVRVKSGLKTSAQQFLALQPFPFTETLTVDKWFAPWREPIRVKIGLRPSAQQFIAWSAFTPAEIVTVDKWFGALSGPSKRKSLLPAQQQFAAFQYPVAPPVVDSQFSYSPQVISFTGYLIYQSIAETLRPIVETVTIDKWFAPWHQPVRVKSGLKPFAQQFLALQPFPFIETVTVDKWFSLFVEPYRRKSLLASQQQFLAAPPSVVSVIHFSYSELVVPYSKYFLYQSIVEIPFVIERTAVDKWFAPWRDPVRVKAGLSVSAQPFWGNVPFVERVTIDKWFAPWREPVRVKVGLKTASQPFIAHTPFTEQVTIDKWFVPWREPVRVKVGLKTAAQPFIAHTPFVEVSRPDKWFAPWRDPVRVKLGLRSSAQQFLAWTTFIERRDQEDKWHRPWEEPVRLKRGLWAGLQQFLAYLRRDTENVTISLDATEIGDDFSGRINVVYCFHSLVSIVEIAVPDQADVSSVVPVATFASVSINEVKSAVITSVSIIETC